MTRTEATKYLRARLDEYDLRDWHIRLNADVTKPLGLCSYKDKTIILNALHIDTHTTNEVMDTINHEIAHALCPNHGHDDIWAAKAKELGARPQACINIGLNEEAIDAIRSGADLKVEFEEITTVSIKPKYTIHKLQDKCEVCGKVAKIKTRQEVRTSKGNKVIVTLECNHIYFRDADSTSDFESIVFDGNPKCKHQWGTGKNRTTCNECGAHRGYKFQIEGARAIERANGRYAILDEQGLGKTLQALFYLKMHEEDAWPFLWVTKSGIKIQHAKEIIRILGKKAFPQVLMTGKDTLIPGMNCIASYGIFRRLDLQMFHDHGFKTIILDECQAIKNPDSSQTGCVRAIAKNLPKIIPTSGTFWKNRGSEAFVMLNLLDRQMFHSYEHFKKTEVEYYYHGNKQKEGGLKPGFIDRIKHIAIRRERTEVMPELPLISRNKLLSEVPDYARKTYNDEKEKLINTYNEYALEGREESFEAQQAYNANLMIMRQIIGIAKVPTTVEFVKEFLEGTNRKIVVFVHHIECGKLILAQLTDYCKEEGIALPLTISASMDGIERASQADKFNGPNYRLLIASTLASGEGLNLQSCSDCIMHERQWNPANEEQAEGRFIRIGQVAQAVTATYVHAVDTCDVDLDSMVEGKRVRFHSSMNKGVIPAWDVTTDIRMELVKNIVSGARK